MFMKTTASNLDRLPGRELGGVVRDLELVAILRQNAQGLDAILDAVMLEPLHPGKTRTDGSSSAMSIWTGHIAIIKQRHLNIVHLTGIRTIHDRSRKRPAL